MSKNKEIGNKQKGMIGLTVMLVFSIIVIFGTDAITKKVDAIEASKNIVNVANNTLKDGSYKAEEKDFDAKGYKGIVTMEVKGGAITALTWDCIDKEGNYKSKLSMDGKYVMTEKGAKWHEQAEALAKYVIENQSVDVIKMDEAGKTDAVASVSITVTGFVDLVKECMQQAGATAQISLKDGSYKAEEKDFDAKGYKGIVTMEVKGGAITTVTWDCIDKEGNYKSKLSMDGKYVMTEKGAKWHEQAEALAKYVIENQSVDVIKMDEAGKTDAVASVSITVTGFVDLVKECMQQATK